MEHKVNTRNRFNKKIELLLINFIKHKNRETVPR